MREYSALLCCCMLNGFLQCSGTDAVLLLIFRVLQAGDVRAAILRLCGAHHKREDIVIRFQTPKQYTLALCRLNQSVNPPFFLGIVYLSNQHYLCLCSFTNFWHRHFKKSSVLFKFS